MFCRLAACLLITAVIFPPFSNADDLSRGSAMIEDYFRKQGTLISEACLKEYRTKEQWEKARPELHRQFMEMLGLDPLPAKTDLKPVITGKIEMDKYTIEKLQFQSMPNLYVIANLYLPKPLPKEKVPVVIYVCGHGNVVKKVDGTDVSFGSKMYYQHHPAWLAEHGYACLILDTLQYSEIPGIHHGTHHFGMWWWHTLGYTPAGVECWNGIRSLDYLETRPEIDMKRVGVTGRSGGGAYSWWLGAADERVKCIIPVAGIADLRSHLSEGYPGTRLEKGVIAGHCDCMYTVNTYRWDFAQIAALCAPRALLLGNSDNDAIFPVPGYRRLAEKTRTIYELYGARDKFDLLETVGPHTDTPELRLGAFRWLNRWLKNDPSPVTEVKAAPLPPEQLKVLAKTPEGAMNATIHDYFIKPAQLELPQAEAVAREWWQGQKPILEKALSEKVFHGWPKQAPPLKTKPVADRTSEGVRLRAWDFTSEDGIELRLWLMTAPNVEKPSLVVLNALDEPGWAEWCTDLGPEFAEVLLAKPGKVDAAKFKQNQRVLEKQKWAFAAVCPRGIGPTKWAEPGTPDDTHIRRRFTLVGQTLDGQRVWDVRRGLAVLREQADLKGVPLWLQGKQDMAGIALYASLYEPDVARLDLWNLPATHKTGPIFLNVRKYLDTPQALALASPKPIRLYVKNAEDAKAWDWPMQLQKSQGRNSLQIRVVGD